jgi:amidase
MFVADGGKGIEKALAPTEEPIRPEMQMYKEATELGTYEMWQLHLERSEFQKKYLDQWMSIEGLDAILGAYAVISIDVTTNEPAPTTPYTSPENGHFKYVGYTGVYNVVDYSAVSFPCGVTANKEKDLVPTNYSPLSDDCRGIYNKCEPRSSDEAEK